MSLSEYLFSQIKKKIDTSSVRVTRCSNKIFAPSLTIGVWLGNFNTWNQVSQENLTAQLGLGWKSVTEALCWAWKFLCCSHTCVTRRCSINYDHATWSLLQVEEEREGGRA